MLFRRDMEPSCAYCERGTPESCRRRDPASPDGCRAFRYDPFKRVPPRPAFLRVSKFKPSDFSL